MAKPGQRVEETIAVRDSHDLPDADELAEEIALVGTAAVALLLPSHTGSLLDLPARKMVKRHRAGFFWGRTCRA